MRQLTREVNARDLSRIVSIPKSLKNKPLVISIKVREESDRKQALHRLRGCAVDDGLTLDQLREERLKRKL